MTGVGITVLMTVEVIENYNELRFSPHAISFLTHDIVLQRYVEIEGELRRIITVIKTRGRKHSSDLRAYEVTDKGIVVGEVLKQYRGLISAIPELRESAQPLAHQGLTDQETMVYQRLSDSGDAVIEDLLSATKLKRAELKRALDRLVALGFVEKINKKGQTVYRELPPKQ
jgi:hypothetical protein